VEWVENFKHARGARGNTIVDPPARGKTGNAIKRYAFLLKNHRRTESTDLRAKAGLAADERTGAKQT